MQYIHTTEYNFMKEKNKLLIHATLLRLKHDDKWKKPDPKT